MSVGPKIMKNEADQTFIREAKAYIQSLMIAEHLATRAFQKGENAAHDARASLVFIAFTIEAFCNHVGWKLTPDFEEFDKLRAMDKLRRAAELAGFPLSLGQRPFQTFGDIFRFRNEMAHSCTQEVQASRTIPRPTADSPAEMPKPPPTEWEAYCTPEVLQRALEDVREGLTALYNASTLVDKCPFDRENWTVKMSWDIEPTKRGPTKGCSPISNRANAV